MPLSDRSRSTSSADSSFLPYGRQWIDDEDIEAVVETLRSDFLTTGPKVQEFEQSLCAFTGAKHAAAVNSGTAALHTAYFAAGLAADDEIITSPLTFAATANAALYLGARVQFVDVCPDTGLLDPVLIEPAIRDKTKLIVPIDFAGHPADYDRINEIARANDLAVVADAAHSLGATYKGRSVGVLCDVTALSLHPVKPITTGEGGAVLTDDPLAAQRAADFRTHGITKDRDRLGSDEGPWFYEQQELGFNYRLTDLQCALGIAQMRRLDAFLKRRREIAARYKAALSESGLELPVEKEDVCSGWHLYVVRVPDARQRRPFFERLRALEIGAQVHYIPVYWHPYYRDLGYEKGLCPIAEDVYARCVSIPIYPKMSDADVESSIDRVLQAARETL